MNGSSVIMYTKSYSSVFLDYELFLDAFWRHVLTSTINRGHKHTVDPRYNSHILSLCQFGPIKRTQIFIFCELETGDMDSCWNSEGCTVNFYNE